MARKSLIERNRKRENMVARLAGRRAALKSVILNEDLPLNERFEARLQLAALPRNSSPVRIRRRCEVTGRARGCYRQLRMSRIVLRQLGGSGMIPGLVKSSW